MLQIHKKRIKTVVPLLCSGVLVLSGLTFFNSLTTYAAETRTLTNITNMQEMTPLICANSAIGATTTLTDTRDGEQYTVRKHEDGNCWMTQNLRLQGSKTLTPMDSDVTSNYTLPASDLNGFDNTNYYANQMYYANDATNGAYYSWTAATAGTGDANLTSGDAPSSVCPKGWKLPPNSGRGSYAEFVAAAGITNDAAGSTKLRSAPYNFSYAGSVSESTLYNVGFYGDYWSRTAYSDIIAYHLGFDSSTVYPAILNYYRYLGFPVRCVAASGSNTTTKDGNLSVEILPTLTIDAVTDMDEVANPTAITAGNITATVSANGAYQVLLSAKEPNLTSKEVDDIIPASNNLTVGTNGWGIATNDAGAYAAITTVPTVYYNTTAIGKNTTQTVHTFNIGATISPTLPASMYSTLVTVTATAI